VHVPAARGDDARHDQGKRQIPPANVHPLRC
jgi:hypothetical protein